MPDLLITHMPIVARQAIFDIDLNVHAYELLFHSDVLLPNMNATEWAITTDSSL